MPREMLDNTEGKRLGDSLRAVLDDEAMAKRMGAAGLARARESFSWGAIGEKTAALYRELV